MRVLIVGGAGFVGTNLARYSLRVRTHNITVVDSLEPRLRSTTDGLDALRGQIQFIQADMRDATAMANIVRDKDVIFNCAGQTSHPISMKQPIFDTELNNLGNLTLLEAVREHASNAVMVFMSSSTVVGKANSSVIDEQHSELPLDIYSANKLAAEKYYRIYNRVHGLKTVVLRFANLYGPYGKGDPEFGFVNYFIHVGQTAGEIRIFGSGEQKRNLLYVEDACEVMWRAAQEPRMYGDATFVAHDDHLSVREIAEKIVAATSGKVTHVEWPEDRKRIEIDDVKISCARLRSLIPWSPRFTFAEGLAATIGPREST